MRRCLAGGGRDSQRIKKESLTMQGVKASTTIEGEKRRAAEAQATPQAERKIMTGAEIVWASLERLGVETVFGYPGGAILPTYDALTRSKVHHVLVRHEQGATHMADGYARASGRVGVAIATSGPGATNMVTATLRI